MSPTGCGLSIDYYWRDYSGTIPRDAVEGGRNAHDKTIYIGQVYVNNRGLIPVTIHPGKTSVVAAIYGVHEFDKHIKILCSSSKERFQWVPTNEKSLQTINKHLVVGGVEKDKVINIGRISYQAQLLISKVCGYKVGKAKIYFPAGKKEEKVECYEVLVYD